MSVTLSLMGWDSLWSKKQKLPRKTSAQVYQLNLMVLENGWNFGENVEGELSTCTILFYPNVILPCISRKTVHGPS